MTTSTEKSTTVVGLFNTPQEAESAIRALTDAGIPRDDISLISRNRDTGAFDTTTGDRVSHDKATVGEHVAGGAVFGGIGGLLLGLAGLAIPGIGPVVAAGPLAAALTTAGIGAGIGAATGGIIGAIRQHGVPEEDAHLYAEGIRRGGTLVTVHTDQGSSARVEEILNSHGAVDVDERRREYEKSGWNRFSEEAEPYREGATYRDDTTKTGTTRGKKAIPVVEEKLNVGKREVERGGVRVYNRVTEQPVQQNINLTEERVNVERRPVNRPASESDLSFRDKTIEVKETAEVPVVSKEARVVEEVVVGKERNQRTETVRDTVRKSDVNVEQLGRTESNDWSRYDNDFRSDFQTRYGSTGAQYDTYAPAYQYGYRMAGDERYRGKSWNAVENDLRSDYERSYPGSAWERTKDAVRYGWEKVTGRR
jgi:uncharacterized protein (TIGR02271 family)